MKKLLMFIMLSLPLFAMAQADSVKTKPKEQYCMVTEVPKTLSTAVNISVDFGQPTGIFSSNKLKDEAGKVKTFNSIIDALNYMASLGWELVSSHVITYGPDNYSTRHIMRKRVE